MILDSIDQFETISQIHDEFPTVFQFLKTTDWKQISDGKHEIPNTNSFVIVASDLGRGKSDSPLEVHQKYIDIQVVIEGKEMIGWSPFLSCQQIKTAYDEEKDLQFFSDLPQTWVSLRSGQFAVFFPNDAHAPLAGSGPVRKAVAKVPVAGR